MNFNKYTRGNATPDQVEAAKGLDTDHLYCRTIGHRWVRVVPGSVPIPKLRWGKPLALRCESCDMTRLDIIDTRGQVSYRIYRQPTGYRIPARETPRRDTLRLELLKR